MTLVLSLISESWAIQVSDRRLVYLGSRGEVVRKEDERNKAVLWCNRLAFAYTGLAELGPMRENTDVWLSRELAEWWSEGDGTELGQDALVATIIDRATAAMKRPRIVRNIPRAQRMHAFAGTGWARFDGVGEMVPYIVQIHNQEVRPDGTTRVRDEFGFFVHRLPEGDNPIFVNWIGQELGDEEALLDNLKRSDPASKEFGPYAAEVLAEIVRRVADRNQLVGRGLLISALPRWAIRPGSRETFLLAGGPSWDDLTFLHLPSDADDPVIRGPLYVCRGTQMSGFETRELSPEVDKAPHTPH
jgi:hypothetical protein